MLINNKIVAECCFRYALLNIRLCLCCFCAKLIFFKLFLVLELCWFLKNKCYQFIFYLKKDKPFLK